MFHYSCCLQVYDACPTCFCHFPYILYTHRHMFCFSTGLVRLYIAGLPLRSCRTIGAPSVQGSAQCAFFPFLVAAGFEPTSLSLGGGRINRYPILTHSTILVSVTEVSTFCSLLQEILTMTAQFLITNGL